MPYGGHPPCSAGAADWPAIWSRDLFTFDEAWARVVAGYGLAAVVHPFIGHAVAGRLRRH